MIRVSNSLITHLNVNLLILKIDVQSYRAIGDLSGTEKLIFELLMIFEKGRDFCG